MKQLYTAKSVSGVCLCLLLILVSFVARAQDPSIDDQSFSFAENEVSGYSIGTLTVNNPLNVPFLFSLDDADGAPVALDANSGALRLTGPVDFETLSSYTLTVSLTTDPASAITYDDAVVTLSVLNIDEPPYANSVNLTALSFDGATISGEVFTNGLTTAAAIQYETDPDLAAVDPDTFSGKITIDGSEESRTITASPSLQANTTYYYRVIAKNSAGIYYGDVASFTTYSIPKVNGMTRLNDSPMKVGDANYTVIFSEKVKGVDVTDFILNKDAAVTASITAVLKTTDQIYEVQISVTGGDGNLQLQLIDDNSITGLTSNVPLGGALAGDGDYVSGPYYTVDNTPPTIVEVKITNEDTPISWSFNIGDTPSGPSSTSLEFSSSNMDVIGSSNYAFSGTGETRTVKVTPNTHKHGVSKVTIRVVDPVGFTAEIAYEIRVLPIADAPLVNATDVSGDEDTALPLILSTALVDTDGSEQLINIRLKNVPAGTSFSAGTNLGGGVFEFTEAELSGLLLTPPANYNGEFELTFQASAQEKDDLSQVATASTTFTVTVNSVNDIPTFVLSESLIRDKEDFTTVYTITVIPGSVPADEASQPVQYTLDPASTSVADVKIDATTGQITITALANANGTASFTVIANDQQAENNLFEQTFDLIIEAVNDAPAFSLSESRVERNEDFTDVVKVAVSPVTPPADETGQVVSYSLDPASLSFANLSIDPVSGEVTITSKPDLFGKEIIKVIANDGQAENNLYSKEFVLAVNQVNDAPAFTLDKTAVVEEEDFATPVILQVIPAPVPADEVSETVTYSLQPASLAFVNMSIDAGSGEVTISSIADAVGTATVKVIANDGQSVNATFAQEFSVTVTPVNDAPEFELSETNLSRDEDFEDEVVVSVIPEPVPADEKDQTVTYTLSPATVGFATVSFDAARGEVTFTAVVNANGSQLFTVTANDGQALNGMASRQFRFTVNAVNDAPEFSLSAEEVVADEDFEGILEVTVIPEPVPADETSQTVVYSLSPASVDFANIFIDRTTGRITIDAKENAYGEQTFTVTANDGQAENNTVSHEFTLIINSVNDAPTFTISPTVINELEDFEGTRYVTITPSWPANEADESVEFDVVNTDGGDIVSFGNSTLQADGSYLLPITSIENLNGESTYDVVAFDGLLSHEEALQVNITGVNDPISCESGSTFTFTEDAGTEMFDFSGKLASDIDVEVSISLNADDLAALPSEFISIQGNVITADIAHAIFEGLEKELNYTVRYTATSSGTENGNTEETCSGEFKIIVVPVNDAPEILDLTSLTQLFEGETATLTFSVRDEETAAEELVVSMQSEGTVSENSFTLSAADAGAGMYQIVVDPQSFSAGNATLTITTSDGEQSVSSTTMVQVLELFAVPTNLFTPNGDGRNDRWEIPGLAGYSSSSMLIYDERGQLLYQNKQYFGNEWDGKYHGKELPDGAYYYQLTIVNEPGTQPVTFKGVVHIAR